ncbi:hypothetical protein E3N88_40145 [Mikania micrantha]|uniref:Uncharacterized protein n=1 Tax=Mikania micrantha TaxID=192012 RepID=A0A5N6LP31_9ASTR|nr:hypothetical protein E3N88_40145 [Mikania micrantha]
MARDIEEADISQPLADTATASSSNPIVRARPDPVLATCRCFSFVTVVASVLCIVANVFSAIRSFTNGRDIFDGIFRCYAVVIAVFVVVAETEWSFIIKFWKVVLEYWAGRGMLQIFVAVMTRAYPDTYGERHEVLLLQDIASYMLLACGFIYVVSASHSKITDGWPGAQEFLARNLLTPSMPILKPAMHQVPTDIKQALPCH